MAVTDKDPADKDPCSPTSHAVTQYRFTTILQSLYCQKQWSGNLDDFTGNIWAVSRTLYVYQESDSDASRPCRLYFCFSFVIMQKYLIGQFGFHSLFVRKPATRSCR